LVAADTRLELGPVVQVGHLSGGATCSILAIRLFAGRGLELVVCPRGQLAAPVLVHELHAIVDQDDVADACARSDEQAAPLRHLDRFGLGARRAAWVASHVGGVVVAAGCFIAANFLLIGSGYWTSVSSGLQVAQVTLAFSLAHPWTRAIASGPDGAKVQTAWWLAPFLGIGTAVMLALAVLFPLLLLRRADPDLKAMGKSVYQASKGWAGALTVLLVMTCVTQGIKEPDIPGTYVRNVPQPGGWMFVAASVMVMSTLRRTERHLRQPPRPVSGVPGPGTERHAGRLAVLIPPTRGTTLSGDT
jgi:hypothetical protein